MAAAGEIQQGPSWLEAIWMQSYLDRLFGDDEIAWFEAYLLDSPKLLDALSADLDLRDGLYLLAQELIGSAC